MAFVKRHSRTITVCAVFFLALVIAHFAQPAAGEGYDPRRGPHALTEPVAMDATYEAPVVVRHTGGRRPQVVPYEEVDVADGGTIGGTVTFSEKPVLWTVEYDKDEVACGYAEAHQHPTERVVFDEQTLGVANVVVSLVGVSKGKAWAGDFASDDRTAVFDQKKCVYIPHILAVRTETQVELWNSDPTEHNVHCYKGPGTNYPTQFNELIPSGAKFENKGGAFLESPGVYFAKCDIHAWMSGYIHVMQHPYFQITTKNGRFELKDVPPGSYTLRIWHEGMKERATYGGGKINGYDYGEAYIEERAVEVPAGGAVEADFVIPAPKR